MENFKATIRFSAPNRQEAEKLFTAFCTCIATHVPYQAILEGNVQMNLAVVNHTPDPVAECGGKTFVNHYRCPGNLEGRTQHEPVEWSDTWCCACNYKCPECNAEIEPFVSEEYHKCYHEGPEYCDDVLAGRPCAAKPQQA